MDGVIDMGGGVEKDIKKDIKKDMEKDIGKNMGQDVGKDVEKFVGKDVGKFVGKDVGKFVGRDVEKFVGKDVGKDMGQNMGKTFTGHKGLQLEEPLLFESGSMDKVGVDFPEISEIPKTPKTPNPPKTSKTSKTSKILEKELQLGACFAPAPPPLPALSEPEAMRHYVRLSQKNHSIDAGIYPLGSCTMKHNPRLNEKIVRLKGLSDIHPLQPQKTVQGALALMYELAHWLKTLTHMDEVALSPKAGAHGELCGMMAIRTALEAQGTFGTKKRVLVPQSAHGTNPSTAHLLGFEVDAVKAGQDGYVTLEALKDKLDEDVAALMLTNPNTCGLFEEHIIEIASALHKQGSYFYCDGANFNAIVGRVRPGELGIDAMHINLHKTFSTPHGGGGPGAGPTVFSKRLAPYVPLPYVVKEGETYRLIENIDDIGNDIGDDIDNGIGKERGNERGKKSARDNKGGSKKAQLPFGRLTAFQGQMGMYVRALAYMLSHGSDGLRQVSEDAVLNANYILAGLKDVMTPAFQGHCMHEVLFDDRFLKGTDITSLDFAKALIDEGYHPMTIYFPLIVKGALLIEPTETESKASLDLFIATMRDLVSSAKKGDKERFLSAPKYAPRKRLDETKAARNPILTYEKTQNP